MAVILFLSIALGRFISSLLVKKISLDCYPYSISACRCSADGIVVFHRHKILAPKDIQSLKDVPVISLCISADRFVSWLLFIRLSIHLY